MLLKKLLSGLGVVLVALIVILGFNYALFTSERHDYPPHEFPDFADKLALAERLGAAVRFETISREDAPTRADVFRNFHVFLERSFPQVHREMKREVVADFSLVFEWKGSDPELLPVLFMAHQDVVPVGLDTGWEFAPFGGEVRDGYILGRGTLDDKGGVMAVLEAAESLLAEGYRPRRTIYIALGHDEEKAGTEGAGNIGDLFRERGLRFALVQDEGMPISVGLVPGVDEPVALIGIAQKGEGSLELTVSGESGHSSMPPPSTTVGRLARAIARIEENPMAGGLAGPVSMLFDQVGAEMKFGQRLAFANRWLFGPIIEAQLEGKPSTNASLRTTLAPTMFRGSNKDNVLPVRSSAVVNMRIHPRDSIESVVEHVKSVIDDPAIEVSVMDGAQEPSVVSSPDTPAYAALAKSIRETFPEVRLIAPALFVAISDTRHVKDLSDNIYRFHPLWLDSEDLKRLHGPNERISVDHYFGYVKFMRRLIQNGDMMQGP